ncbi:SgcJ/EcaC family oxidoreductase [Porifericola rhodea]|uniref:YybH family protein n=1 Tax=Porifericola rhodea TaxID=930972 RepID=UPI002666D5F4|nr:SgcJ/EcaC family oxidoreductase [Porifericola rhodea]WKN30144.1 SgcJ/EcaC family oxidoreductase [Porifericola rhodea]
MENLKNPVDREIDEQKIRSLITEKYPYAVRSGQAKNYSALYTSDVTYLPYDGPACHSPKEIEKFYNMITEKFRIEPVLSIEELKVLDTGEDAYAIGLSTATLTPKDGSAAHTYPFRVMWLFHKVLGQWKIHKQVWNVKPQVAH